MGDGNENEKSPLLVATETTAAYSEDVIGKYIFTALYTEKQIVEYK